MSDPAREYYESVSHLFYERGMELGLGRPLTAEEALEDPVIGPMIDRVIDHILGVETVLS